MIECITVSVNYSDYLLYSAHQNRKFFKKWVIATISSDLLTIEICKKNNIDFVLCDDIINKNNARFNKSALLNRAYHNILKTDWILILDSDIILPHSFNRIGGNTHIYQKENLYGIHRWQINSRQSTENYVHQKKDFPDGASRIHYDDGALGYFQLFHNSSLKDVGLTDDIYNETHENAANSDTEFRDKYRKLKREKYIEHFDVFHTGPTGINWNGRISDKFQ